MKNLSFFKKKKKALALALGFGKNAHAYVGKMFFVKRNLIKRWILIWKTLKSEKEFFLTSHTPILTSIDVVHLLLNNKILLILKWE